VRFVDNVPKVVLLDVGMTAELNAHSRAVMLELFKVSLYPLLGDSKFRCTIRPL
jgi:hypothetical protein